MSPFYGFASKDPNFKSLSDIARMVQEECGTCILSFRTLKGRIESRHPSMKNAVKDSKFGKFWVVPNSDAQALINEALRVKELRDHGYFVSVRKAEKFFGFKKDALRYKDMGQQNILGVWMITRAMFARLKKMGRQKILKLPNVKVDLLAKHGTGKGCGRRTDISGAWLDSWAIRAVKGAFRPKIYVHRIYMVHEVTGEFPCWAKKENGRWLIARGYVEMDAQQNLDCVGVVKMARVVGCRARTVIRWIDEGIIPSIGRLGTCGERMVLRKEFIPLIERLRRRLEDPAVIGRMKKLGHKIPKDVLARIEAKKEQSLERLKATKRALRRELRTKEISERLQEVRQELRCARDEIDCKGKSPRPEREIVKEFNKLMRNLNGYQPQVVVGSFARSSIWQQV